MSAGGRPAATTAEGPVAAARSGALRLVMLVLGIVALAALAARFPVAAAPDVIAGLGPAAPVVTVAVAAGLLIALVPRTPLSVACGLLLGPVLGPLCAVVAAMIAAVVTFALGRALGRDAVVRQLRRAPGGARLRRAWERVEQWITREGVLAVAAVRSWPLGPYGLVGYAYGTSGVRVRDYAIGSLIAGTPSAVVYALLGAAAGGAAATNPLAYVLLLPAGLVLTAVVAVRTRRYARRPSAPAA